MFKNSGNIAEVKAVYQSKVKASDRPKIITSHNAYHIVKDLFNHDTIEYREEFIVLMLNRANRVIGWVKLSDGGTCGTVVDPKICFTLALQCNASSLILAHNHPSCNEKPSNEDVRLTKKIKDAELLLEISLMDHIIVCPDNKYFSFADEGMI